MQTFVQIVQIVAPVVTVTIFYLGLRAWYQQLAAKRRFEVAEQAILVFKRASDAISTIRNPVSYGGEHEAVKIPENMSSDKQEIYRSYAIHYDRSDAEPNRKAFEDVRLTQLLAEVHISEKAGQCFLALFRVRHLALVAAHMLIEDGGFGNPQQVAEQQQRRLQYHNDLYEVRRNGAPKDEDRLSKTIDEATAILEEECKSKLRAPGFWDFVFGRAGEAKSAEWSDTARDVLMVPKSNPFRRGA